MSYDRRTANEPEGEDTDLGELGVAEYLVFLFAFDTYQRYLAENGFDSDDVVRKGLVLLKAADRLHRDALFGEIDKDLPSAVHKKMLAKAFNFQPTLTGMGRRALQLRTVLSRGGASTMRAVFQTNRALMAVKEAIGAAMIDDADAALDKFAVITITKNPKMRDWIDDAAKLAGSGTYQNAVAASAQETSDDANAILANRVQQQGATVTSVRGAEEAAKGRDDLTRVQVDATEAAKKAMGVSGEADVPPARSEVVGIATAAAVASVSDPGRSVNVPEPLRKLDEEQRAAAMTDGRVLVAAGAGAGKSTTLVARIKYLVSEKRVNPSRILACSFNAKAAAELREKIAKSLGGDARGAAGVQVGTMHALFYKFIVGDRQTPGYGNPEERAMLVPPRLIAPPKKGVKSVSPASLSMAIRGMWKECKPETLANYMGVPEEWFADGPPKAKKVGLIVNGWQGNDVGLEQAKQEGKKSKALAQAALWYEMYLGIKGDLPGWRPPCGQSKAAESFNDRYRKGGERLGDLDDMIKVFRNILRRDPAARKAIQGNVDHILVDECVHGDTLVTVEGSGTRKVRDVNPGDLILSYVNGTPSFKAVRGKVQSRHTTGLRVTTASGLELDMTSNHRLYATSPNLAPEGQTYLYLMYRKDLGFRIGVSDCQAQRNGATSRACQERADALWVLDLGERSEMLYQEQALSLAHGIPTQVFEGTVRGLDQERIDRIFSEYGEKGRTLLEAKGLDFNYPNWVNTTASTDRISRLTINVNAHRPTTVGQGGTAVCFSWTGELPGGDPGANVYTVKGGRKMFNRRLVSYVEARKVALELAAVTGARVRDSIEVEGETCLLVTASALCKGMSVPVLTPDGVVLDVVTEIYTSSGDYYDLSVEDSANFFGNGVLSHNCQDLNLVQHQVFEMMSEHVAPDSKDKSIWMVGDDKQAIYQFRGAKPELFVGLDGKEGWKTRQINTNYRCEPEIVDAANRLAAYNEGQIPMEARAAPTKSRGNASIDVVMPPDNAAGAIATIGRIRKDMDTEGAKAEDYAVLARTNAELNDFETACIINEIPYIRKGGKGFLEAPESKAVLGYLDLATGNDFEKKKSSLIAALTKPDRNLFLGAEALETAVDEAIDDVARSERIDKRFVDPASLLESKYVRILADRLKQPYRLQVISRAKNPETGAWVYGKRVDELADNLRGLRSDVDALRRTIDARNPGSEELINFVLDNMSSTVSGWDRATNRNFTAKTTLREQITGDVAVFSDDDGDEVEEEAPKGEVGEEGQMALDEKKKAAEQKGLGAVQFLFALAQPNANDQTHNTDPSTAQGLVRKLARYSALADTLRIDPDKFAKEQERIADQGQRREKPPAVTLSTVHSVKGAEWPNVSVLMPAKVFPSEPKARPDEPPPDPVEVAANLRAERNLAYVALTRAAHNLEILCPANKGVSRFVREAGLVVGENVTKETSASEGATKTASDFDLHHVDESLEMYGQEASAPTYSYARSTS